MVGMGVTSLFLRESNFVLKVEKIIPPCFREGAALFRGVKKIKGILFCFQAPFRLCFWRLIFHCFPITYDINMFDSFVIPTTSDSSWVVFFVGMLGIVYLWGICRIWICLSLCFPRVFCQLFVEQERKNMRMLIVELILVDFLIKYSLYDICSFEFYFIGG